jgi:hypothetical protein
LSSEYKGPVNWKKWLKATCEDDGETVGLRLKARKDFKKVSREDRDPFHVASPDVIGEALEGSELYDAPTE